MVKAPCPMIMLHLLNFIFFTSDVVWVSSVVVVCKGRVPKIKPIAKQAIIKEPSLPINAYLNLVVNVHQVIAEITIPINTKTINNSVP